MLTPKKRWKWPNNNLDNIYKKKLIYLPDVKYEICRGKKYCTKKSILLKINLKISTNILQELFVTLQLKSEEKKKKTAIPVFINNFRF